MALRYTLSRSRFIFSGVRQDTNNLLYTGNACKFHWKCGSSSLYASSRSFIGRLSATMRGIAGRTVSLHAVTLYGLALRKAAERLQIFEQILCRYRSIYSEQSLQSIARGFARRHLKGRRRNYALFGGVCFAWDRDRVSDQELDSCLDDVDLIKRLQTDRNSDCPQLTSWEQVMARAEMMVWRRKMDATYLYEYKVFGTFTDCTAKSFFKVQLDLNYRYEWDKHVIETGVIDQDKESGSEVVYWATNFPFPMQSRDYVYVRRSKIFHRHRVMALISQATSHPRQPESKRHVRVRRFSSKMVIKPFTSFDENGFDYILTYHDDPQAAFPSAAVSWMTSTGVPDFVEKMHLAAVALDQATSTNIKDLQSDDQYARVNIGSYS